MDSISNATNHPNIKSLKASIMVVWVFVDQGKIRKNTSSLKQRLEAVVEAKGHIASKLSSKVC